MPQWFTTVTDLEAQADVLRRRRYGVIEIVDEQLRQVRLRPFPKMVWLLDVLCLGRWYHRRRPGNRCLLYFNQPRRFPNFLAVCYAVSARDTTLGTIGEALRVMDQIARLKRTDALLADVANVRISDRALARWGWQPHAPQWLHRNFIKRLYPAR